MIGHVVHGTGPRRVLMLHGWFTDHSIYDSILPALPLDRMTVALMDQRGYGLSKEFDGPFDIATIARDGAALADHLGWDDYLVVGHSMGGKAALRLAVDRPENVRALIGIAPVWAGAVPFDEATMSLFASAAEEDLSRRVILGHSTSERLAESWYLTQVSLSYTVSTMAAFGAYFRSWSGDDFARRAAQLTLPVDVVAGQYDQGISKEAIRATWLAALPQAELHVLPDVGHYPMLENAAATGRLLAKLLAR